MPQLHAVHLSAPLVSLRFLFEIQGEIARARAPASSASRAEASVLDHSVEPVLYRSLNVPMRHAPSVHESSEFRHQDDKVYWSLFGLPSDELVVKVQLPPLDRNRDHDTWWYGQPHGPAVEFLDRACAGSGREPFRAIQFKLLSVSALQVGYSGRFCG